jgi:L-asparaginase / beta-aspartyl-peptidase
MNCRRIFTLVVFLLFTFQVISQQRYALVVHGGAGVMSKSEMKEERRLEYLAKLEEALQRGESL